MKPYEWEPDDIRQMSKGTQNYAPLDFVIDFDTRTFVDNWVGDSLQDHIPAIWIGVAADPFEYVPAEVQDLGPVMDRPPASACVLTAKLSRATACTATHSC